MAFWEVLVGWLLVALLYVSWEVAAARVARTSNAGGWLRAPVRVYVVEALLLTLLGTLWFASIGSGTWPLVFALLGMLIEWPGPVRHGLRSPDGSGPAIRRTALGVARTMAAGAVLWLWIG